MGPATFTQGSPNTLIITPLYMGEGGGYASTLDGAAGRRDTGDSVAIRPMLATYIRVGNQRRESNGVKD